MADTMHTESAVTRFEPYLTPILAAAYGIALHLTGNRDGTEGLSYQDIAEIVGCPVGTVRSRLHRGRRMLQKALWNVADCRASSPTCAPAKNSLATRAMAAKRRAFML